MLTLFSCGPLRKRILAGTACALAAGAIVAAGCGGATGGLPSGIAGALNNVVLTTTVVNLAVGAGGTRVPPGSIASVGTYYLKLTLKGAGVDGNDVSYFFDIQKDLAVNNNTGGFGAKEQVYDMSNVPAGIFMRPVRVKSIGGVNKYVETTNFSFTAAGKTYSVKVGDIRKTFVGGDYVGPDMTLGDVAPDIGTAFQLTANVPKLLNKDRFDVVFDFLADPAQPEPTIVAAIAQLNSDGIDNRFQQDTVPNGRQGWRLYRVILPASAQVDNQVLDVTKSYNAGGVGDPTLNYSAPLNVDLTVSGIPKQAKYLNIRAIEEPIATGGTSDVSADSVPRFEVDVPLPVDEARNDLQTRILGTDIDGGSTFTRKISFLVVNRLRKLKFEVRAFLAGPHTGGLSGNDALNFLKDEYNNNPYLAQVPIASNIVAGTSGFKDTSPGLPLLTSIEPLASTVNKIDVLLNAPGTLTYLSPLPPVAERDRLGFAIRATMTPDPAIGTAPQLDLPARSATMSFDNSLLVVDTIPAGTLPSLAGTVRQKDRVFQNSDSVVPVGGKATAKARATMLAPYGSTSVSSETPIDLKVFGSGATLNAATGVSGFSNRTASAKVTIEECQEGAASSLCTTTGVKFENVQNLTSVTSVNFPTIPVVSRGLSYQVRYQVWSEKNAQGVLLAERIVGQTNNRAGSAGFRTLAPSNLADLPTTSGIFAADDSNLVSLRVVPAGTTTSRGATVQVTPLVTLVNGTELPIAQSFISYSVGNESTAQPTITALSGASNGQFSVGAGGSGTKTFTVAGSLTNLAAPLNSPDSDVITVSDLGIGGGNVTVNGYGGWPAGNARLTGPQRFTLKETTDSGVKNYVNGPIYGFSAGSQSATFNLSPRSDFTYQGIFERLAAPSGGGLTPVVLALAQSTETPHDGSATVNRLVDAVTSNVSQIRLGLLTSGTPGQAINIANLKTTATGRDDQVLTLTPAANVSGNWVALDPSLCTYTVVGGFLDGHQIGGSTLVLSNGPRATTRTYTIRATYFEVDGTTKTGDFTLTVPGNRRGVEVIIK